MIAILMATYNGERFLTEQIESILAQTYKDWHIFVHDDGSTDGTMAILTDYATHYPGLITILDYPQQGGACRNFLSLLERVEAPYYMFSDQDDVWHNNKVERSIEEMKRYEKDNTPTLIHTDLSVVDEQLNIIAQSFVHFAIKTYPRKQYIDYATGNTITGCTVLINDAAKQIVKRPYDKALMHDSWLSLSVAAAGGTIHFVNEQTILYRQHGNNALGADNITKYTLAYRITHCVEMAKKNIKYYQEMNAVKRIPVAGFIWTKIKQRLTKH